MSKALQNKSLPQFQTESLITPDIKAQLDQFMKGTTQLPQLQPANKNIFKRTLQKLQRNFFHFDRVQSRKIKRFLSYADVSYPNNHDEVIRGLQTKYNMIYVCGMIAAFTIPRGFVNKAFFGLVVTLIKSTYLDSVVFYHIVTHRANTNTLTELSQEYRNILTYYSKKRLENQNSPVIKTMLTDLVQQMEANTKQYFLYKSKEHLL